VTPDRGLAQDRQRLIWQTFAIFGLVLFLLGLVSVGVLWLPFSFGEQEWEYGTSSNFFDIFPLLGLGSTFLAASALALGRKWTARSVATFCLFLAVFMWLAFALFATVFPAALGAVSGNAVAMTPVKKAGLKTAIQALVYPFALLWLSGAAWRVTLRRRGGGQAG